MLPLDTMTANNGMKAITGANTGLSFRAFVCNIDDTEITAVKAKYNGATAAALTLTDHWYSGKKFYKGEFWSFGEDYVCTEITTSTGGEISIIKL